MSRGYRSYALGLASAVYMVNLLDRFVMGLLLEPIRIDLHLSDTQLGLLTGLAFGVFYALAGVPIARLADRGNRVTITSVALAAWSATVMASLFVTSFAQLAVARVAAAVGEAGCKPPTYSLVGDYFPEPAARTRAMAVYWMGAPLATLLSFIWGGWLSEHYGWRITLFCLGVPGIFLAVLVKLTLHEPRQPCAGAGPARVSTLPPATLTEVFSALWRRRTCRRLVIALVLFFTMAFGLSPWNTVLLMRVHGIPASELGVKMGLIVGVGGLIGVLFGGYVATRWFGESARQQMRMCAISIAVSLPCYLTFLLASDDTLALAMLLPTMLVFNIFVAPTYALLQRLVPDEVRASTMAVVMLAYNLIGMGLGPQVVGLLSDLMTPVLGVQALRYAMVFVMLIAGGSVYFFWRSADTIEVDLVAVDVERERRRTLALRGHA